MNLRNTIKAGFRKFGWDVHRFTPTTSNTAQIVSSLAKFHIDLVLDVGANCGQFATEMRTGGYSGKIVSFEPLSTAYSALLRASDGDSLWEVFERCALGNRTDEIKLNVAGNSVSSSVLSMLELHSSAAVGSAYVASETVPVFTLDSLVSAYLATAHHPFLKIDTQGFEWEVLDGARQTLPHLAGIMCELSLTPLYEKQRLWIDLIKRLESDGFTLWSIQKGFTDPRDGRTLQVDAVFFRV